MLGVIKTHIGPSPTLDVYNGIRFSKIYRVYFTEQKTLNVDYIKNELEKLYYIDAVEYDYHRKAFYTPNDPRYNNQWFLEEINSNISGLKYLFSVIFVNDASTEKQSIYAPNTENINSIQIICVVNAEVGVFLVAIFCPCTV